MHEDDVSNYEGKEEIWKSRVAAMRERLKNRIIDSEYESSREDKLYHGLKLTFSTNLLKKYASICFCSETHEYFVLEKSTAVYRYSMQGKPIQPAIAISTAMSFTHMIWCAEAKAIVGYIPQDELIWLMSPEFVLYQVIRNEFSIGKIFYEPTSNEMIVVGPDKAARYPLENKEKTLHALEPTWYADREHRNGWNIEHSALIPRSTSLLRLAGSYLTTLYVMPVETEKDAIKAPMKFIATRPAASSSGITALYYHGTSMWIVSGDEQGNVMGWTLQLECVMQYVDGHSAPIREIISHPTICGFLTSDDQILQVWSCNFRDKMERFTDIGKIWSMALNESAAAVATLGEKLSCFNMHQLYHFYAPLTAPAANIFSTTNPMYPTRVVVASSDNIIRILSSPTGKQLNVQMLLPKLNVIGVAYSGISNRLFTIILETGEILVSNTKTNPVLFRHVWLPNGSAATCIIAYEHYEEIRDTAGKQQKPRVFNFIRTSIIIGTNVGTLIEINEENGAPGYTCNAHSGPITKMHSSTKERHLITTGMDQWVKVWKIFPNAEIPFALVYTLYYTVPITHINCMGFILCLVSSTNTTEWHQLKMHNMFDEVKLYHHSSKDHKELILDVKTSESLNICATSSMDHSIRIWDEQNNLQKILEINIWAPTISFSSLRGDIVFAAGKHLYKIPYANYLPSKHKSQIMLHEIPEDIEEMSIPENTEYRIYESELDQDLMLHPVNSTPLESLDASNSGLQRLDLALLEHMSTQYRYRDADIIGIRDGMIEGTRLVNPKALMTHDEWENYIGELLNSSKIREDLPPHNIWETAKEVKKIKKSYNEPAVFRMLYGYSMERFPEYPASLPDQVKNPRLPLFGFLPNSVIYKILEKEESEPEPLPIPSIKQSIKYKYPDYVISAAHDGTSITNLTLTLSQIFTQSDEM